MRIAVLCATHRGARFLGRLHELLPDAELLVWSFREEPVEPPFYDDIQALAAAAGATFVEARSVGAERFAAIWESAPIDLLFAVSWRYMIPPAVYTRARLGAFVFHDSLLPAYRGFSPTVWALVNGERTTGATLFHMAEGVDAGDIVDQAAIDVGPGETIAGVMERVTGLYLAMLDRSLAGLCAGTAPRRAQDHAAATYTCRRVPADNRIDWSAPTARIHDLIRAVTAPYSGAETMLEGRPLRIWAARPVLDARRYIGRVPGRVVEVRAGEGAVVLTGDGELLVERVQRDGEAQVPAAEVLKSLSLTLGR